MDIRIRTLVGKGCRCCADIKPKLERICSERGFELEIVDLGEEKEIPKDLTGIPYTIIIRDNMYVTSFQGDMPERLLEQRIDNLLKKHCEAIDDNPGRFL